MSTSARLSEPVPFTQVHYDSRLDAQLDDLTGKIARAQQPDGYLNTHFKTYAYMQAHVPVGEQTEIVSHAVRAMYLYSLCLGQPFAWRNAGMASP